MDLTRRIAAVLGPTLAIVTVSEVVNLQIWEGVHPTVVYLNGLVFLVGGLVIATVHNHWRLDFGLLVTLSGWLLLIAGALRMFFPKAQQLGPGVSTYIFIAALFTWGIALTLFAFLRSGK
ncbi:MAG: hypothetical protein WAT09_19180 [Paracoccaceae bacterium]